MVCGWGRRENVKFGSIQKPFPFTWQVEGEELYQISGSYHDLISI
jgi:hypothetical protein